MQVYCTVYIWRTMYDVHAKCMTYMTLIYYTLNCTWIVRRTLCTLLELFSNWYVQCTSYIYCHKAHSKKCDLQSIVYTVQCRAIIIHCTMIIMYCIWKYYLLVLHNVQCTLQSKSSAICSVCIIVYNVHCTLCVFTLYNVYNVIVHKCV